MATQQPDLTFAEPAGATAQLVLHPLGRRGGCAASLIAAILFVLVSSARLTSQGLYYDELHQATASFAYIGRDASMFSVVNFRGIAILNMPYSGALKSGLYGLYLRASGAPFSVVSWRMAGILLASAGLLAALLIAGRTLAAGWAVVFLGLLLTDATVILAVRHDWGPVALALLLRLVFIAVWLRSTLRDDCKPSSTAVMAFTAGLSVFEKLTNLVLALPLMIAFALDPRRRTRRHFIALILGGAVSMIPLAMLNLYTYAVDGWPISLTDRGSAPDLALTATLRFASDYLSLGQGAELRAFILGAPRDNAWAEALLMVALLALSGWISLRHRRESAYLRFGALALLSYLAVGVALRLMPQPNYAHHWIMGTPFQYAAFASALAGAWAIRLRGRDRWLRTGLTALLIAWVALRLVWLGQLEWMLVEGQTSEDWDPSLTAVGEFAAANADRAIFVAADWGLASQIVSLSNGEPGIVEEAYWEYDGPDDIERIANESGKEVLYVVAQKPRSTVAPSTTEQIWRDIGTLRGWREQPVEAETAGWKAVDIRKFVRDAP